MLLMFAAMAVTHLVLAVRRVRFRRWLRLSVTSRGLELASGEWRAAAPWSAIRSVVHTDGSRGVRFDTEPPHMLRPPWWFGWFEWTGRALPIADLGLGPDTLNAAIGRFTLVEYAPVPVRRRAW